MGAPAYADKPAEIRAMMADMLADNYAARQIGKNCKSARANESAIGRAAMTIRKDLLAKGYTKKEINAGLKGVKIANRKADGAAILAQKGAKPGDEESYCKIAQTEVQKKTYLGSILKLK